MPKHSGAIAMVALFALFNGLDPAKCYGSEKDSGTKIEASLEDAKRKLENVVDVLRQVRIQNVVGRQHTPREKNSLSKVETALPLIEKAIEVLNQKREIDKE